MISVIGSESVPAFAEVVPVRRLDSLLRARVAELADDEARMSLLRGGDGVDDRFDLVDRLVLVAADVEVDEDGAAVFRDLARIAASERRADVLDGRQLRDARDDVADRRREGGIADASGAALDQDALAGGLLEPVVEDLLHAAGLSRPGRVLVDHRHAAHARRARRLRRRRRAIRTLPSSSGRRSSGPCGPRGCVVGACMRASLGGVGERVVEGVEARPATARWKRSPRSSSTETVTASDAGARAAARGCRRCRERRARGSAAGLMAPPCADGTGRRAFTGSAPR